MLADEPTGNLDGKTSAEVLGLIKRTSAEFRQTVVMITPVSYTHLDVYKRQTDCVGIIVSIVLGFGITAFLLKSGKVKEYD